MPAPAAGGFLNDLGLSLDLGLCGARWPVPRMPGWVISYRMSYTQAGCLLATLGSRPAAHLNQHTCSGAVHVQPTQSHAIGPHRSPRTQLLCSRHRPPEPAPEPWRLRWLGRSPCPHSQRRPAPTPPRWRWPAPQLRARREEHRAAVVGGRGVARRPGQWGQQTRLASGHAESRGQMTEH